MKITHIEGQLPRRGAQDTAHSIGSITKIIVHHDAQWRPDAYDDLTRYISQANYHISRGEDGLQYHFKISNLGDVYQTRRFEDTLWHCGNYPVNRSSIAICLDGDFTKQQPTDQQLFALQELLDELCTRHPEFPADKNDVFGHREVGASACPGNNLIDDVIRYRTTGHIIKQPKPKPKPKPVQDPPAVSPKLWRVYDYQGHQVGAYSHEANAIKKLDTMEAGTIKDEGDKIIKEKIKQAKVINPYIGDKPPVEPPQNDIEPPKPREKPEVVDNTTIEKEDTNVAQYIINTIEKGVAMTKVQDFLKGKKTLLGILVACLYSVLIYFKIVDSNELIWTAILGWTGVSLRLAVK